MAPKCSLAARATCQQRSCGSYVPETLLCVPNPARDPDKGKRETDGYSFDYTFKMFVAGMLSKTRNEVDEVKWAGLTMETS